jgi:peptidoglycan/xylan/chitin deacetylase (PgdA/CDA1 family)
MLLPLYYRIKPLIPRRVQLAVRGAIVRSKRGRVSDIWPIDEKAAATPSGWKGWPEGKRFAFVLTHDVETAYGQEKCRLLAELEMSLGFRSSFNFVAEDYPVDRGLQRFLVERGFEVGLHGLNHRGNIFSPVSRFLKEAPKINHYLREWGAVGFRAPTMYRDFSLLQLLDILYDSSSFDTDPFEPQPWGLGTIFPRWIPSTSVSQPVTGNQQPVTNSGFVELPYTCPQDHTLFLILREKDGSIWKSKLDWIAEKRGMALVCTHPDYMDFDRRGNSGLVYQASLYADFLSYVLARYKGDYWHALPKEVAAFWKTQVPTSPLHLSAVNGV